jgi:hypothetical protein
MTRQFSVGLYTVVVELYVSATGNVVLERRETCTGAGWGKKKTCTGANQGKKKPAPVQVFTVFGSSYVHSYTTFVPQRLGLTHELIDLLPRDDGQTKA